MITISSNDAAPAMLFTTMAGIHQSVNLACALHGRTSINERGYEHQ